VHVGTMLAIMGGLGSWKVGRERGVDGTELAIDFRFAQEDFETALGMLTQFLPET